MEWNIYDLLTATLLFIKRLDQCALIFLNGSDKNIFTARVEDVDAVLKVSIGVNIG